MKQTVEQSLEKALTEMQISDIVPQVMIPSDASRGDYTSNIAMIAAKKMGKNPMELAESIKAVLFGMHVESIEKIDVVRPGFLNFWLSEASLVSLSASLLNKKDNNISKNIMVEFTDPNPFKEFHIGHLYSNIVGES